PFAPGGSIFRKIIDSGTFGIRDLYAAYLLQKLTNTKIKFGRDTENQAKRGKTRYLFYHVVTELLKDCMAHVNIDISNESLSETITKIFSNLNSDAASELSLAARNVIDDYMTKENEDSAFTEPKYENDMNNYMKWDKLGKGTETPGLNNLIAFTKRDMRRNRGNEKAARDIICESITN
ncbi:MAG: hypothetical protein ACTHJ0_16210, partial [Flavipsychrobacter sp.]